MSATSSKPSEHSRNGDLGKDIKDIQAGVKFVDGLINRMNHEETRNKELDERVKSILDTLFAALEPLRDVDDERCRVKALQARLDGIKKVAETRRSHAAESEKTHESTKLITFGKAITSTGADSTKEDFGKMQARLEDAKETLRRKEETLAAHGKVLKDIADKLQHLVDRKPQAYEDKYVKGTNWTLCKAVRYTLDVMTQKPPEKFMKLIILWYKAHAARTYLSIAYNEIQGLIPTPEEDVNTIREVWKKLDTINTVKNEKTQTEAIRKDINKAKECIRNCRSYETDIGQAVEGKYGAAAQEALEDFEQIIADLAARFDSEIDSGKKTEKKHGQTEMSIMERYNFTWLQFDERSSRHSLTAKGKSTAGRGKR